jgi:hypothetical protein
VHIHFRRFECLAYGIFWELLAAFPLIVRIHIEIVPSNDPKAVCVEDFTSIVNLNICSFSNSVFGTAR